jgi:hypothetical protein
MDQHPSQLISTSTESHSFLRSRAFVWLSFGLLLAIVFGLAALWPSFCLYLKDSENNDESKIHQEVICLVGETYEARARRATRVWWVPPRKESSYEGRNQVSQGAPGIGTNTRSSLKSLATEPYEGSSETRGVWGTLDSLPVARFASSVSYGGTIAECRESTVFFLDMSAYRVSRTIDPYRQLDSIGGRNVQC